MIREFINDLYVIEIRALRDRVRAGLIAKHDLAAHVKELRKRYPLVSPNSRLDQMNPVSSRA